MIHFHSNNRSYSNKEMNLIMLHSVAQSTVFAENITGLYIYIFTFLGFGLVIGFI